MLPLLLLALVDPAIGLNVDIRVDREDQAYEFGERIEILFEASRDCYAAVYDIEPGGRAVRLFPREGEEGWIKANQTYRLPESNSEVDYVVGETEGEESFVIVANPEFLPDLEDTSGAAVWEVERIMVEPPEPVYLRIITTPSRGRIYITEVETDETEYIGKAPRTIVLKPGEYIVTIKRVGYCTMDRRIVLEPGDRRRVFVRLLED